MTITNIVIISIIIIVIITIIIVVILIIFVIIIIIMPGRILGFSCPLALVLYWIVYPSSPKLIANLFNVGISLSPFFRSLRHRRVEL